MTIVGLCMIDNIAAGNGYLSSSAVDFSDPLILCVIPTNLLPTTLLPSDEKQSDGISPGSFHQFERYEYG